MQKNRILSFLAPMLCVLCQSASCQILNRDNIESTFSLSVPVPEVDSLTLSLEHLDRWNGFFDERTEYHNQIFFHYSLPALESFSLGLGYRRKTDDLLTGEDDKQNRFMADLIYKWPELFGTQWDFDFRTRWELIDSSEVSDGQVVRGRIRLRRNIPYLHIKERPLRFQIYDELYYDITDSDFSKNKAGAGIVFPILTRTDLTLNAEWKNVGSIGDDQEGDNTALVSLTLEYSLPKNWLADLVGGEVGDKMKGDKDPPPQPVFTGGPTPEIPSEPPPPASREPIERVEPSTVYSPPLVEIPWETFCANLSKRWVPSPPPKPRQKSPHPFLTKERHLLTVAFQQFSLIPLTIFLQSRLSLHCFNNRLVF